MSAIASKMYCRIIAGCKSEFRPLWLYQQGNGRGERQVPVSSVTCACPHLPIGGKWKAATSGKGGSSLGAPLISPEGELMQEILMVPWQWSITFFDITRTREGRQRAICPL